MKYKFGGTACRRPKLFKHRFRDADTASLPKSLEQLFHDLHRIERRALEQLIAAYPEA